MNVIRFNLNDIIDENLMESILMSLKMANEELNFQKVIFWHDNTITDNKLDKFRTMVKKIIDDQIMILITNSNPQSDFAWFDVINDKFQRNSKNRFTYIYHKKSDIVKGIGSYKRIALFIKNNHSGKKLIYNKDEKE